MNTKLKHLQIGDLTARLPIIQGGMGVGVSLSKLAGAVAKEGGVGIISTAQIGYDEEGFEKDQAGCNRLAIRKHIQKAKEIACGNGLIGVNIMVALKHYEEHVKEAVAAGADVIISGAGLPMKLPALVSETCRTKIAPIVSSKRALQIILKRWAHRYDRTADFIVIEGPKAGGHLGFKKEELLENTCASLKDILKDVKEVVKGFEELFNHAIPVFVAGGIYTNEDIKEMLEAGADGVQMGTRFIGTYECDASMEYKNYFINGKKEDIKIVQSPVGMPGRAFMTPFMEKTHPIKRCFRCIASCDMKSIPYCITQALINAVNGDCENGLVFTGTNGYRIDKLVHVSDLIDELMEGIV